MVDLRYANAYSEVLEILKYIPNEDYEKIPKCKIKFFEMNANKSYFLKYNPNKTLEEQNVSKIAKVIIGILYRDYWSTESQKKEIIERQSYNRNMLNLEKKGKNDVDNAFKIRNGN